MTTPTSAPASAIQRLYKSIAAKSSSVSLTSTGSLGSTTRLGIASKGRRAVSTTAKQLPSNYFGMYTSNYDAFADDIERTALGNIDDPEKPKKKQAKSTSHEASSSSSSTRSTSRNTGLKSNSKAKITKGKSATKSMTSIVTATTTITSQYTAIYQKTIIINTNDGDAASVRAGSTNTEQLTAPNLSACPKEAPTPDEDVALGPESVPLPELEPEDEAWLAGEEPLLSELPVFSYKDVVFPFEDVEQEAKMRPSPAVVYVTNQDEADDLIEGMKGPIGFDMEWPVPKTRGMKQPKTALIQLATKDMILLIHLYRMRRFPEKLRELIESETIIKTGVNIRADGTKLWRDFGIVGGGMVELSYIAKQVDKGWSIGKRLMSLQKIVAKYLKRQLLKEGVRTSNWNLDLDDEQIEYACNDTYCGLVAYHRLMDIARADGTIVDLDVARVDKKALDLKSAVSAVTEPVEAAPTRPAERIPASVVTSNESEEIRELDMEALGRAYVM